MPTNAPAAANIIVKNNTLDQGYYSNGVTSSTYNYAHCAQIFGTSLIEGNVFMNPAASADMLKITDGSCIVRNNRFVRHDTTINSYIKHNYVNHSYSSIDQITDNNFDQTTVDGYSERLVYGLNPSSVYTRNKNQSGFIYIPIYDNTIGTGIAIGAQRLDDIDDGGGVFGFVMAKATANNLITYFSEQSTASSDEYLIVNRSFHLGDYLEKGMEVTSVRVGGYRLTGTLTDYAAGSYFGVILKFHEGLDSMDATQFGVVTPGKTLSNTYDINSSFKFAQLATSTQFTVGSGGGGGGSDSDFYGFVRPDYQRAGNGYQAEVEFKCLIQFDSGSYDIYFTPIEVKYIW